MRTLTALNRTAAALTLVVIAGGLTAAPAPAAYCGIPDDTNAIVKLTIATYPKVSHASHAIDASYIRIVDVNGTYAYSATQEGTRRIRFYWEKPTGTWHFVAANNAPADWGKPLITFFDGDDTSLGTAMQSCNNPNWKNHPQ